MKILQIIITFFLLLYSVWSSYCASDCAPLSLDLIFILDSSDPVYDSEYTHWQNVLDFTKSVVNNSLSTYHDTRIGLINYSGCNKSYTFATCQEHFNYFKKEFGLNDYGNPNDRQQVYDRIDSISSTDFNTGSNWINDAFGIAFNEFSSNSTSDNKMIILVTNSKPTTNHEPCLLSSGFISNNLQNLQDMNALIVAVTIDMNMSIINEYFECLILDATNVFYLENTDHFDILYDDIANDISFIIKDSTKEYHCGYDISLIINEIMVYNDSVFIEVYNAGIDVLLTGFSFKGLINYVIKEDDTNINISYGEYWVISTFNITAHAIDTKYKQNLLIDSIYSNITMDNNHWTAQLSDCSIESEHLLDTVERETNDIFFPNVTELYTFQLMNINYDNALGGNWKQSCYIYGTPQNNNDEICTVLPTQNPSIVPTLYPTDFTLSPTDIPTFIPTELPSKQLTIQPTMFPSSTTSLNVINTTLSDTIVNTTIYIELSNVNSDDDITRIIVIVAGVILLCFCVFIGGLCCLNKKNKGKADKLDEKVTKTAETLITTSHMLSSSKYEHVTKSKNDSDNNSDSDNSNNQKTIDLKNKKYVEIELK